jgi:hypothetical protein
MPTGKPLLPIYALTLIPAINRKKSLKNRERNWMPGVREPIYLVFSTIWGPTSSKELVWESR